MARAAFFGTLLGGAVFGVVILAALTMEAARVRFDMPWLPLFKIVERNK